MGINSYERLVGCSAALQDVNEMILRLAPVDTTVLLHGETGTGKELVAEALHVLSPRASKPFVRVNCAAFSEQLLESELFGHIKGAFTGAIQNRIGCFEAAEGGTLFLDEIGDIPSPTQVRLLRVLEEKQVQKVGCNIARRLNVRVVTASNKNLADEVAAGRFRADLFYRLNTVIVSLPPLRERREDIPALAEHFIQLFNKSFSRKIKGLTPDALAELAARSWPGNVRELKNVIEHAFIYCKGEVIGIDELGAGETVFPSSPFREERRKGDRRKLPTSFVQQPEYLIPSDNLDADLLQQILEQHHWHMERAAASLGIHRTTLWRYMQRYGITRRN